MNVPQTCVSNIIDLNKSEMKNWSTLTNMGKFTWYTHLQSDIGIKAQVDKQTKKIFGKLKKYEC